MSISIRTGPIFFKSLKVIRFPTTILTLAISLTTVSTTLPCEKNSTPGAESSAGPPIHILQADGWTFPRSVEGVSGYNSDCKPSVTENGHQFYFIASDNNGPPYGEEHYGIGFNVYVARWTGAEWDSVTNLGPNVNPSSYSCISGDGQTIYLTRGEDIYVSTFDGTGWTTAVRLPPPVNDLNTEDRAPFITRNGHQLYFASNRLEGYGNRDLWVVRWNGSAWDSLTNLGPDINTTSSETHPSLTPDGQTLFFSDFGGSRDVWKFGDSDLFMSEWTGSGWGTPSIVGAPVNSDHPLCSSFPLADGSILVGSGVSEGGFGEEDIWVIEPDSVSRAILPDPPRLDTDWVKIAALDSAWNVLCLIEGWDGTLYAGTAPNGDVFRSSDGGSTWEKTQDIPGVVQVYSLLETSDHTLFAGTYPYGDVYSSTDGGDTWNATGEMPNATAVRALLETSSGSLFAGTSPDSSGWGRIYRSDDGGRTWVLTGPIALVKGGIFALFEGDDNAIFAGGRVQSDRIFVSQNGGLNWEDINLPYDDAHVTISNTYFFERSSDGTLWAGGWAHGPQGMLVHSTDNGVSWDTTASIMNGEIETALIFDMLEEDDGSLLIGYHPGPDSIVMRSGDGGVTWESAGYLPGAREALCLLRTGDGDIFVGTSADGGIYRKRSLGFKYDEPQRRIPSAWEFGQNYPNPFNPHTVIRYRVPKSGQGTEGNQRVRVSIYDIRGRLTRTLVDEAKAAGEYSVQWDGRDDAGAEMPSGSYLCRIEAGEFTGTKKMTLVR